MHASRVVDNTRSFTHYATNTAAMEAALAELNSLESPCIAAVARKYGIKRTTLSRRWKGVTTTRAKAAEDKRFLDNQQEQQLLQHIRQLYDRCLFVCLFV
jgi:transposase-like protein